MKTTRSSAATARPQRPEAPARAAPRAEEEPFEHTAGVPRYQTFTVRFLVEPGGACRRTEVAYVQGGASDAWPGYDQERLAQWIATYVQPSAGDEPAPAPGLRPALRDLVVLAADAGGARHLVAAGQPLTARLTLDLSGAAAGGPPVAYTATVYARSLGGASWPLGIAYGRAPVGAATPIEVAGMVEQPGTYRVSATVTLGLADGDGETLVGDLIQVYEDCVMGDGDA